MHRNCREMIFGMLRFIYLFIYKIECTIECRQRTFFVSLSKILIEHLPRLCQVRDKIPFQSLCLAGTAFAARQPFVHIYALHNRI